MPKSRQTGPAPRPIRKGFAAVLRGLAAVGLILALFPAVVVFCGGLTARTTLANPGYVMRVVRDEGVIPRVKADFLDGLVGNMDLSSPERAALRTALDEGVRVEWLDTQLENVLRGFALYLGSDHEELRIRLPVVELKIYVLAAVRRHMGDDVYLRMASGLEDVPDFLEIGPSLDLEFVRQARPYWRAVVLSPLVAGGAALLLSALLWLTSGRNVKGVALAGGVWAAAGLTVVGSALSLDPVTGELLPALLPLTVPELGSLSLHSVVLTAAEGVRGQLLAVGVGAATAGAFMLVSPQAVWERRRSRFPRSRHIVERN